MNLGIDLGTFNSSGAVALDENHIVMIESVKGKTRLYGKRFPSFVYFDHQGEVLEVGERAKSECAEKSDLVVWGVKRLVGLSYKEAEERGELQRFKYEILPSEDGGIHIKVGPRCYQPQDILRIILKTIKADAENPHSNPATGGQRITTAVISVPAYFKAWRTNPICEAAREAGFTEVQTIAEPTAAALRYSLQIKEKSAQNEQKDPVILTFDLGAGTLDVTILQLIRDGNDFIPGELCVSGNEALGGIDMDEILVANWSHNFRVPDDPNTQSRFREDVENAKIRLSKSEKTTLNLPMGGDAEITRGKLESDLRPLLEKCRGPIQTALKLAELSAANIDYVLFVGGPTHMPCVRAVVADELKRLGARTALLAQIANYEHEFPVDPMDCVSQGAALKASGVLQPEATVLAEGYGTILDGTRYAEILPPNARYPIQSDPFSIIHGNPNTRRVPVPLVAKVPYSDSRATSDLIYRYRHLGEFGLAIIPSGQLPSVSITIEIDQNKRVLVTLQHTQSGQPVEYRALDSLTGFDTNLSEKQGKGWSDEEIKQREGKYAGAGVAWTDKQLTALLHAARALLDQVRNVATSGFSEIRQELEREIRTAAETKDPRQCPAIWNRTQKLASAMLEAKLLSPDGYLSIKSDLDDLV
jgi:molecular chaperone DnaK